MVVLSTASVLQSFIRVGFAERHSSSTRIQVVAAERSGDRMSGTKATPPLFVSRPVRTVAVAWPAVCVSAREEQMNMLVVL